MSKAGVGSGWGRGARRGGALVIACACAIAPAACSEDVVRAKRSALGSSPDAAATPDPSPPLIPAGGTEASWNNLWGSWPLTRYAHGAAFDTDRKVLVVYGGQVGASGPFYNDTWEWDGTRGSWRQRSNLGANAGERVAHAMAYDPGTKKTFMFSGWQPAAGFYIPGQWEWDAAASAWNERVISTTQPSARHDHTLVYNPDRQRIALFGGFDETPTAPRKQDLWEWNGMGAGTWEDCTPAGMKPPARYGHSMAYDSTRKTIVVRGGNTGTGTTTGSVVNETWEWTPPAAGAACNTGTWAPVTTTGTAPTYNYVANRDKIVYDVSRSKMVLYEYYANVYELDYATPTWTPVTITRTDTNSLPPYDYLTATYDPFRSVIMLFSGTTSPRKMVDLDGAGMTFIDRSTPVNGPIQRTAPALGFDSKRGKLILFGGHSSVDGLYKQDTWEWSGTDATFINRTSVDTKPDPRQGAGFAYDSSARDRFLLFGGLGAAYYNDLWAWSPATRTWSPVTVNGASPTARQGQTMFYDAARDKFLVFGGSGTEIWEYNPTTSAWTNRTPTGANIPQGVSTRSYFDVTFDSDRGKLIMLGGNSYNATAAAYSYNTDIWEWDTTTGQWAQVTPGATSPIPQGRIYHSAVYDQGRKVLVMVGGRTIPNNVTTYMNDSWEWDAASATWTETSPATAVRPLPRESHQMVYNTSTGTTFVFGGTVPADTTYGPQEIWEYVPNSQPRPNGSGCSAATAAHCASGFCVDGVCCASASCPATCQSCNASAATKGTCSNLPPGSPDDTCASDQACDASQKCKTRAGLACATFSDCASGHCADGVCCNTDCTDTCKACNLNGSRGVCSNISLGVEDPIGAPACVSDPMQGRACDGNGLCSVTPRPNGSACTTGAQCNSHYCIDGFCCSTTCNTPCYACNVTGQIGNCYPLPAGQQDHSATTTCDGTMQYCGSGVCQMNKKPNGATCTATSDCGSTFCVDGVCCNSACTGVCTACNVTGRVGTCSTVPAGGQDNVPAGNCAGAQYCDATGVCQSGLKANGVPCASAGQCGSGNCVDGFCCDSACGNACTACNVPNSEGTCTAVNPGGVDSPGCVAPNYCLGGACTVGRKPNGASCVLANECGSNNCVDGTCCDSSCGGKCLTCKNATGTCTLAAAGTNLRSDCGTGDCAGSCDGQAGCNYPASGKVCGTAGCAGDGLIHAVGTCDGAGKCNDAYKVCDGGFTCYHDPADNMDKCRTSCANDMNCLDPNFCNNLTQCPGSYPNGQTCDRDRQCMSKHCALSKDGTTGTCCDRDCSACGTCNLPGMEGTCVPTPAGTDPNHDCINSASDPTGKCGGICNGQWGCQFPQIGTACGTCKTCDGASKCIVKPDDDDACGVIDCDMLDTSCSDYHDLTKNRCGSLGVCKTANSAMACTDVTVTCMPDAGQDSGMSMPDANGGDGATTDTGGGLDAGKPPTKGGGGCGCAIGTGGGANDLALLASLVSIAGVIGGRRRRRSRR